MNASAEEIGVAAELNARRSLGIDPSWDGVVRWGGLALLLGGVIAVLFFVLVIVTQQTLPIRAVEALEAPFRPAALFALTIIGEALLLPSGLALYFALKGVRQTAMYFATAFWVLCVPMFFASRGLILAVSQLSRQYSASTDEVMRAAYVAAAELALETEDLYAMLALILLSIASIVIGVVMLKGPEVFGKGIGYLVIGAGVFTFFGAISVAVEVVPIIFPIIGVILGAIWQIYVGLKLFRLGREAA